MQGLGSGVILALTEIILADLVPLRERGAYQGALGLIWSVAYVIGPLVGGAFAQRKDWTWRGLFCKSGSCSVREATSIERIYRPQSATDRGIYGPLLSLPQLEDTTGAIL